MAEKFLGFVPMSVAFPFPIGSEYPQHAVALAVQNDQKLLIQTSYGACRVNQDGTLDLAFDDGTCQQKQSQWIDYSPNLALGATARVFNPLLVEQPSSSVKSVLQGDDKVLSIKNGYLVRSLPWE